jgi:hypothetical protein
MEARRFFDLVRKKLGTQGVGAEEHEKQGVGGNSQPSWV